MLRWLYICDSLVTSVRTNGDITSEFPLTVSLHQGSTFSLYFFVLVVDEPTRSIQNEIPWCMVFTYDFSW